MSKYGYHDVFYSRARELVYKQVKWTATEKSFRSTTKTEDCTLFDCLTKTVMKSAVGAVIGVHPDDRETILEYTDTPIYFTSDPEGLIQKIRNVQGILTVANAIHFLTDLRLMDCNISEIDRSLRTLENLKFLNLSGNRIHGLHGEYLPRHLNFLELFKNNISDIQSLCQGTPKTLIHIGLARNKITNLSNLNALGKLCQCASLDLGDNDIIHLLPVLSSLSRLNRLRCLNLQGNPCAMSYSYARAVKEMCPKIRYLDYIPLKVGKSTDEIITEDGCLFFRFFGLSGLEKPGKQNWEFFAEVDIPLFDPRRRIPAIKRVLQKNKTDTIMLFGTNRMPWNDVLHFPIVWIAVPYYAGLTELRDVFRTAVSARIVRINNTANTEDILGEFTVNLESIPWCMPQLEYEWLEGSCVAKLNEGEHEQGTVQGLRCSIAFGVERF